LPLNTPEKTLGAQLPPGTSGVPVAMASARRVAVLDPATIKMVLAHLDEPPDAPRTAVAFRPFSGKP